MDPTSLWNRYCDHLYQDPELGFELDISRMRFSDAFLKDMAPAMDTAIASMKLLEAGAIANPDENRMVGHYWLRNPELAPREQGLAAEIHSTRDAIAAFGKQVTEGTVRGSGGQFEHFVLIGIGGSMLGPQFIAQALAPVHPPLAPHFIDNTDPDGIARTLARLDKVLDRTLVIVTSKSGGTPEPRNGMLVVEAAYKAKGLEFAKHAVAVTGPGSKLDRMAESAGWLARFPMADWVGGRTSVMSAVGLLPAVLLGIDVDAFLSGAAAMDERTRREEIAKNPAALLALMWYHAGGGHGTKDMVVLPYKDRLELFSRYLQQLVMESLGKRLDRSHAIVNQGIAVYGNKGSTDQHAYVQQLRDGLANFFAVFVEVLEDRAGNTPDVPVEEGGITCGDYLSAFLQGTRKALFENERDSITITITQADAAHVGQLIALFERAVGLYAELVNINAYHQPGVEAGKKAAAEVLEIQKAVLGQLARDTGKTAEELAAAIGRPETVETVYKVLVHLASNPGRGVRVTTGSPRVRRFQAG